MARILLGLLLLKIFTLAHCLCRNGWQEKFGNCYLFVNVGRSHHLSASICERYGSKLANPKNVNEFYYLNETAANAFKNTSKFWIGYSKGENNDLDGYWDNSKPNSSEGNCVAMNNLGLFMVDNCFWPHSFVCQRNACRDNEFTCTYGDCTASAQICNLWNDCRDRENQINCPEIGNYVYNSLSQKISVNESIIKSSLCRLIIEVPIGYRIVLAFRLYNAQQGGRVWSYGIKKGNSMFIIENTSTVYSKTNLVIAGYMRNAESNGLLFDFNYTSIAISSSILQATNDPQKLSFPESWMMFLDLELSWKIETATGTITLQLFELVFPNSGKNSFYIWYGDDMAVNLTDSTKNQTFTSNTSEVFIYFYSENDNRNVSLNLTYQIHLCQPGEFRNNISNTCQDCNEGYYQPDVERGECLKCPENHTTLSNKSKSKDDCIFYCASAGYEIGPSRNECIPCAQGFYKKATAEIKEKCSRCPQNLTTSLNQGATKLENCDLIHCTLAGYEIGPFRNECIPCAKGFYKKATDKVGKKCSRCPQNFTTSLNQGATTLEDCDFKLCLSGEFRNNISNTCQDCNKGYYQPNVEKGECLKCPENRTTISTKSKSKGDCILECIAGYVYNRSSDACIACPKGTYKSEMGYHPCIACTGNMTTRENASTQQTDCLIPNCPAGEEPTGDYLSCKKCSLGYYKSDSSSIHCIQCPVNTTTLQTGATSASQCPKEIVPNPAILNTVVIVFDLQYSFLNCEMNQAFYEGVIKSAMEKRLEEISKEWNFCIGDCLVTVIVNCPTSNRKKRATGNGNADVQVGNVKSDADSKTKDERTLTENIFTQDCKVNPDEYQVNSAKLLSCAVSTSCSYSKLVYNKCVFCPAGTKAIQTGCVDCPEGTYSGINQRDCTNCSFPLTSKSRSNSSSQCLSKCILDSTYCKNGAICSKAVDDMHHICSCSKKFSGDQCEIYNEPYDHGKWWVFVMIGCIGLILVIIQLVVVLVKYSRTKHEEKKHMIQSAGNGHSSQFLYWSPMQGHRANQSFATNWKNIRKLSH